MMTNLGNDRKRRVLSQVQMAEMRFSRKVFGVRLRDKVHSCGIRKPWV